MKRLLSIMTLMSVFIFSTGCTKYIEVPVFVEASCPKLETLKPVGKIDVIVSSDGAIRGDSMYNLIKGAKMLRKSEGFYIKQITTYNSEFVKSDVDK